MVIYM